MKRRGATTFLSSLLLAYAGLLALPVLLMLAYIGAETAERGEVRLLPLFLVAGLGLALGLLLFRRFALRQRLRFRTMIGGMESMLEGQPARSGLRMPGEVRDELGQLGLAFNELQDYLRDRQEAAERELELSRRLQRRLLPEGPRELAGFAAAAACVQTREVGGDLYDVVPLSGERFAVIVGDVAGKGMPAALLMSGMMTLFRREVRLGGSPADVLGRLNRLAYRTLRGQSYVSMGLALFDAGRGSVRYASAGHMPPYVLADGRIEEVPVSSLPLGAAEGTGYRDLDIPFPPGSRLALFTDGMVESVAPDGKMFGFERFERLLLELDPTASLTAQVETLMAPGELEGAGAADDRTVLLVRRNV